MSDPNDKSQEKGFAGLAGLTSRKAQTEGEKTEKASALMTSAPKEPGIPEAWQTEAPLREPMVRPQTHTKPPSTSGAWVICGILGVIVVGGILIGVSSNKKSSEYLISSSADAAADAAAVAAAAAATDTTAATIEATEAAAAAVAVAVAQSDYLPTPLPEQSESRPPVGTDLVLSGSQIRYCLFEKYRIEGAEGRINQYDQASVNLFNEMVDDFNRRCASYRYLISEFGAIEYEARDKQSILRVEGEARMSSGGATVNARADENAAHSSPDPVIQAIQVPADSAAADAAVTASESARPDLSSLSSAERQSIEAVCSNDKYLNGPSAYNKCLTNQLAVLASGVRRPDLSSLSSAERQSIEAVCSNDKYLNGPSAYNKCLTNQLAALTKQGGRRPDLSRLSSSERQSIEAACSNDKYLSGPAAYNQCLDSHLIALERQGGRPDLSGLSSAERRSVEAACSTDRYLNGPAAYNACLAKQLVR